MPSTSISSTHFVLLVLQGWFRFLLGRTGLSGRFLKLSVARSSVASMRMVCRQHRLKSPPLTLAKLSYFCDLILETSNCRKLSGHRAEFRKGLPRRSLTMPDQIGFHQQKASVAPKVSRTRHGQAMQVCWEAHAFRTGRACLTPGQPEPEGQWEASGVILGCHWPLSGSDFPTPPGLPKASSVMTSVFWMPPLRLRS